MGTQTNHAVCLSRDFEWLDIIPEGSFTLQGVGSVKISGKLTHHHKVAHQDGVLST